MLMLAQVRPQVVSGMVDSATTKPCRGRYVVRLASLWPVRSVQDVHEKIHPAVGGLI